MMYSSKNTPKYVITLNFVIPSIQCNMVILAKQKVGFEICLQYDTYLYFGHFLLYNVGFLNPIFYKLIFFTFFILCLGKMGKVFKNINTGTIGLFFKPPILK